MSESHNVEGFREFKYGWPVVLASLVGIGLGMSPLPLYTIIVFGRELGAEFGWTRDVALYGLIAFSMTAFVAASIVGRLTDRFGVRRVTLISIVTFSLAMMAFSLNNGSVLVYVGLWMVLAFAGAGTLPITFTRAVTGWYSERRGLALGVSLIATGLFGSFSILYAKYFVENYDWQTAYIAVGALPLLISLPVALFFLRSIDDPAVAERAAKHRVLQGEIKVADQPKNGMSFGNALKDWRFWALAFVFLCVSFSVGGPIPNLADIIQARDFTRSEALHLASYLGIAVLIGRLGGGYIIDRVWAPGIAFILLSLPIITLTLFSYVTLTPTTALVAVFLLGMAAGVEYDLMAFLVSKYFGIKNYGAIYGMLYGFFGLGAGCSPVVYAWGYEATGSYDSVLKMAIFILIAGVIPLLFLGRYREFDGEKIVSR